MGPEAAKTLQQVARLADCTSQYEFMSLRRRALCRRPPLPAPSHADDLPCQRPLTPAPCHTSALPCRRPPLPTTWMPVRCSTQAPASRHCVLTSCLSADRQVKLAAQVRALPAPFPADHVDGGARLDAGLASRLCVLTSRSSAGRQVKRDFMVFSLAAQNRTAPKRVGKRTRPAAWRGLVKGAGWSMGANAACGVPRRQEALPAALWAVQRSLAVVGMNVIVGWL